MKKILSIITVLAVTLSAFITPNSVAVASVNNSNNFTVESYIQWVESQILFRSTDTNDALEFLNEFNSLSDTDKEQFVTYINDHDLVLEALEGFSSDEELTLSNGDIVIANLTEDDTLVGSRSTQNRIASMERSVKVLGITVVGYAANVRYSHNGSRVTQIQSGHAWTARNLVPFNSMTWSGQQNWGVNTTSATHIGYCTWSFVHSSLGITAGTHEVGVRGTVNNTTTSWVAG